MFKRKLKSVTLLGIDCVDVSRLQAALDVCEEKIDFAEVKLLTSLPTDDKRAVQIQRISSVEEYSQFCIELLHEYVNTSHVLLIQYDGFILNPDSWTDEFLKYDYIGAPWLVADWSIRDFNFPESLLGTRIVGNGGFSLRSATFLKTCSKFAREHRLLKLHPEDVSICVWYRDLFEKEGIRFAPPELAAVFSIEGDDDVYEKQFGFHGFSWTNIDTWASEHAEHALLIKQYRKARLMHFHRQLTRVRDEIFNAAVTTFRKVAIEAHSFGSIARGNADAYSDLDLWFTLKDSDIEQALKNRHQYYSSIGEVIHMCEPPQNAPKDGVHSSILYKTFAGILQVDFYLCPESSAFKTKDSKTIFGDIPVPIQELAFNSQKVQVDSSYRIDFIIDIVFIAVKNLVRSKKDALDAVFKEYGYLSERYGITTKPIADRNISFEALQLIINNLKEISNQRQMGTLDTISTFARAVETFEK